METRTESQTDLTQSSVPAQIFKPRAPRQRSALQRAWLEWASSLPDAQKKTLSSGLRTNRIEDVTFNVPYLKYDNIVILQQKALQRSPLIDIIDTPELQKHVPQLWATIAKALKVSHVGVTAPIPLDVDGQDESIKPVLEINGTNVLRSPTAFQPLHGNLGQRAQFSPAAADRTFWASATQHGVTQMWSPLHTMFSNGNISEKARVMSFRGERGSTAVDLYAGIGYFALFYRKYVANKVICFEINPWSVEGFKRGAEANGWGKETAVVYPDSTEAGQAATLEGRLAGNPSLVMFQESNDRAMERISKLENLPPIRHVNCGYLPSSSPSWGTAVSLIIRNLDNADQQIPEDVFGWIHAHENIAVKDIESRTVEVVPEFQRLADQRIRDLGQTDHWQAHAACDHVAQVKTYAPGVMHCVLDIQIECKSRAPR